MSTSAPVIDDRTPVIIGVGETSERIDQPDYAALSPVELASRASQVALDDAGASALLGPQIDIIGAIRQFEVSGANAVAPFGKSDNFPRSVARRIGADPRRAILEPIGGQGPQHLLSELAHDIARGEADMALICGSEAISTIRHLMGQGETRDWAETVEGSLEDRGYGLDGLLTADLAAHGARAPVQLYALFETARRARLKLDRAAYTEEMGRLFAPFTEVAAANPHAMAPTAYDAEALATVTPSNRLICEPHPRRMVARDQANQAAAVLIASVGKAREMGVPESKWVYLHGGADTKERTPIERQDISAYPAAALASRRALEVAGRTVAEINLFDLYSCFPIAVFDVRDDLGIAADDPRPLTVTGGLPFFGGAGNNYSMHAIASMVQALRERPGAYGFVGANGGFLSKYSVGVYSTTPKPWTPFDSADLQAEIDGWAAPALSGDDAVEGIVETYTVDHERKPMTGVVIGRDAAGARFVATTSPDDPAMAQTMAEVDILGARVVWSRDDRDRRIISELHPQTP